MKETKTCKIQQEPDKSTYAERSPCLSGQPIGFNFARSTNKEVEIIGGIFGPGLEIQTRLFETKLDATRGIDKGYLYYEVKLLSDGHMWIGCCENYTDYKIGMITSGFGDTPYSYSYNGGNATKMTDNKNEPYGDVWNVGDVIGVRIDLNKQYIAYWRNDEFLGFAFTKIASTALPCIKLS